MEHRMICLDNSEWMRNGDYPPTRMKAQRDAANIVCTRHLSANPENTVGVMTLAGPRCTIHATQCTDSPRLHRAILLDNTPIGGASRVIKGIKIARLALKNRPNQKGEARIVLFVGSPLKEDLRQFERVGRDLKKNSCGISVILLGDDEENKAKMEALVNAARKEEGQRCDLIIVPPGVTPLEVVRNSALCANRTYGSGTTGAAGAGAGAGAAAGAGAGAGAGGEDEIQRAIRLSLLEQQGAAAAGADIPVEALTEEEQIRRAIAASMNDIAPANVPETPAAGGEDGDGDGDGEDEDDDDDDEDDEIAQALAMSQAQADADGGDDDDDEDDDDDDDDEAAMIAAAMKFSMAEAADTPDAGGAAAAGGGDSASSPPAIPAATDGGDSEGEGFSDPDYVATLLASIPGASIDDPIIQQALAEARKIQDEREGNNSGSGGGGGGDDSKKK